MYFYGPRRISPRKVLACLFFAAAGSLTIWFGLTAKLAPGVSNPFEVRLWVTVIGIIVIYTCCWYFGTHLAEVKGIRRKIEEAGMLAYRPLLEQIKQLTKNGQIRNQMHQAEFQVEGDLTVVLSYPTWLARITDAVRYRSTGSSLNAHVSIHEPAIIAVNGSRHELTELFMVPFEGARVSFHPWALHYDASGFVDIKWSTSGQLLDKLRDDDSGGLSYLKAHKMGLDDATPEQVEAIQRIVSYLAMRHQ